jgi:hypothetical protein
MALYHVTFVKYLRGIAHRGLNPLSKSKGMATGSNNPLCLRCEGRTFLTEEAGIKFWYGCLEAWAFHESDDPLAEGFTPVVLRISDDDVPEAHIDEEGTNDARAEAWYVTSRIHHETIEVWTGARWACVADLDFEDGDEDLDALELATQTAYDDGVLVLDTYNPLIPFR